jgi:hypothetical protein
MTRIAQKDEELFYLGEFLRDQLRLNVTELKPVLNEPPDGSATITNPDKTTLLLDFEIAEYHVDDHGCSNGGSPIRRVTGIWNKVQDVLAPQLESRRLRVYARVTLKEPILLATRDVQPFASELIRFAEEFCPIHHMQRRTHDNFPVASYPLLRQHVALMSLTYLHDTVVLRWDCSNNAAAFIGVRTFHLSKLVRHKNAKAFNWTPGAEKCLLIYASGEAVTSRAGPPPPDESIWDDHELIAACCSSSFDRIYFWERVRKWHKRLK